MQVLLPIPKTAPIINKVCALKKGKSMNLVPICRKDEVHSVS